MDRDVLAHEDRTPGHGKLRGVHDGANLDGFRVGLQRWHGWSRASRRKLRSIDAADVWLAQLKRAWPNDAKPRPVGLATRRDPSSAELMALEESECQHDADDHS